MHPAYPRAIRGAMRGVRNETIDVRCDKIVPEGKSLGRLPGTGAGPGKVVFTYGLLPGELGRLAVRRAHRTFVEADLLEVLEPAPDRVATREAHYLCCSPWQAFPYERQVAL